MAEAFFLMKMKWSLRQNVPVVGDEGEMTYQDLGLVRYCAIEEYDAQILAAGGRRSMFAEVGRGYAIVKVAGPQARLDLLAGQPDVAKFPQRPRSTPLGSMTLAERNELRQIAAALEFSQSRINGLTASTTYGQLLHGLTRKVRRPLDYDAVNDVWSYEPWDHCNIGGVKAFQPLGSLTVAQRQALRDEALAQGKTPAEIEAFLALGRNWAEIRLYEVMAFIYADFETEPRWAQLAAVFGVAESAITFSHCRIAEMEVQVSG